ncbi:MAG: hypothetical protein WC797_01325 [Candidatus Paceibacterota bacterium]|jgi:hypothetical protein
MGAKIQLALELAKAVFPFWADSPMCPRLRVTRVIKTTTYLCISYEHYDDREKQWCNGTGFSANLENNTFSGTFLGDDHGSCEGAIGFAILTCLPALALSPVIAAKRLRHSYIQKRHGMSHHHYAFLRALKGQIDHEVEAILVDLFHKDWQRHLYLARSVNLEEAKNVLRTCVLHEVHYEPTIDLELRGAIASRQLYWYDEGNPKQQLGKGDFIRGDSVVIVLGSVFVGEEANELALCFKTKNTREAVLVIEVK